MELAVIGREDFCLGFSLAGIKNVFETSEPEGPIRMVEENADIGVVIFDDSLLPGLDEFARQGLEASVRPVFVMLSLKEESDELRELIKKSIGVELW